MSDEIDYTGQYIALVNRYNQLDAQRSYLEAEVRAGQHNCRLAERLLEEATAVTTPMLLDIGDKLEEEGGFTRSVMDIINEVVDSYTLMKKVGEASQILSGAYDKYYTYFGNFNELRRIALGYIVGIDKELWISDEPRKKVEKVYLANTNYWLAFAAMSVMLWASNEKAAADFAVAKSMQLYPKGSALFYLLVNLRFCRTDAAKQWYDVYMELTEGAGFGDEMQYLFQAVLSGAFGSDRDFERRCMGHIKEMFAASKAAGGERLMFDKINSYLRLFVHSTTKEYIYLRRSCSEYEKMRTLLSEAEKNRIFKDYFEYIRDFEPSLENDISGRIEDVLHSLISAYDDDERDILNLIQYNELVVKANGDHNLARRRYEEIKTLESEVTDISIFMVKLALDFDNKKNEMVKKFALNFISEQCKASATAFAGSYRGGEKAAYPVKIEDWSTVCSENDFEKESASLKTHFERKIKDIVKEDKSRKTSKNFLTFFVIFTVLFAGGAAAGFLLQPGESMTMGMIFAAFFGVFLILAVLFGILMSVQSRRLRDKHQYMITSGTEMLRLVLDDLRKWREDYRAEDAVNKEFLEVFNIGGNG